MYSVWKLSPTVCGIHLGISSLLFYSWRVAKVLLVVTTWGSDAALGSRPPFTDSWLALAVACVLLWSPPRLFEGGYSTPLFSCEKWSWAAWRNTLEGSQEWAAAQELKPSGARGWALLSLLPEDRCHLLPIQLLNTSKTSILSYTLFWVMPCVYVLTSRILLYLKQSYLVAILCFSLLVVRSQCVASGQGLICLLSFWSHMVLPY